MNHSKLFSPFSLGSTSLKNRIAMAPMTRSRAIGNIPNALMAEYYAQRADAGLLITEGTSPSPNGLGYSRIPGCYTEEQAKAWRGVTDAVHKAGGHIFIQLMHTGRVAHPLNLPEGAQVLAPSALAAPGQMWTDQEQMQPHPVPKEMTRAEIEAAVQEYAAAAKLAVTVGGFDGVELHGANGYLIEQFINPGANKRGDEYGGDLGGRVRFPVEVARACAAAIGADRVGMRLSPYGVNGGMELFDTIEETYGLLAEELSELGLVYLHLADHSSQGAPEVKQSTKDLIRNAFGQALILSGGYDADRAEQDLEAGRGDLVAFGRPFISNPTLVAKIKAGRPLREVQAEDRNTWFSAGPEGYTDYPLD